MSVIAYLQLSSSKHFLPFLSQIADRRAFELLVFFGCEPSSGVPIARELNGGRGCPRRASILKS
jgi:hypothetical protein